MMTNEKYSQSLKENVLRLGALAGSVLALSGVVAKAASAESLQATAHNTPSQLEKKRPWPMVSQFSPTGVRIRDTLMSGGSDLIRQEALKALAQPKKQWRGILILHAPTKNASIGFTESPTSYSNYATSTVDFLGSTDKGTPAVINEPFLLNFKVGSHERTYALIYTDQDQPAFLDIGFAEEVGALTCLAYEGESPKAIPINSSTKSPEVQYWELKPYAIMQQGLKNHTEKGMDLYGHFSKVTISNVVPHL